MKRCSKCGLPKSTNEFYKDKRAKDGLASECKACTKLRSKKYRETNSEKERLRRATYRATHKNELYQKNLEYRRKNPDKVRKYNATQKARHAEKIKERVRRYCFENRFVRRLKARLWKEANKERVRENQRRRQKANPQQYALYAQQRKARLLNAPGRGVTEQDWQNIVNTYGCKCLCCGRADVKLTLDHIHPLSEGGAHDPTNIQPLCQPCNSRKGTKTIDYRPFPYLENRPTVIKARKEIQNVTARPNYK